jgi:hypothetical protein
VVSAEWALEEFECMVSESRDKAAALARVV